MVPIEINGRIIGHAPDEESASAIVEAGRCLAEAVRGMWSAMSAETRRAFNGSEQQFAAYRIGQDAPELVPEPPLSAARAQRPVRGRKPQGAAPDARARPAPVA